MRLSFILLTAFFISCSEISHNSAEWQIKTYSSAAPSYIGDFATVIGGNGEILREGTNGWDLPARQSETLSKRRMEVCA